MLQQRHLRRLKRGTYCIHGGLPRTAPLFTGLPDTEAFFGWMEAVEKKLQANHWLTSSQIFQALTDRIQAGTLRIAGNIYYVGFDEITPADQRFLGRGTSSESVSLKPLTALTTRSASS